MLDATERNPHCNTYAENTVIATILTVSGSIKPLVGKLSSSMFSSALNAKIWQCCLKLFESQEEITVMSVVRSLEKPSGKDLEAVTNYGEKINDILRSHFYSPNYYEFAQLIFKEYKFRTYLNFLHRAIGTMSELEDFEEAQAWFESNLVELKKLDDCSETKPMFSVISNATVSAIEIHEAGRGEGIQTHVAPTGFRDLDNLLGGGLPRQRLVSILGSAGMGKTTVLLELLVNNSINLQLPSLFFSLEMSAESQGFKLLSKHKQIPIQLLESGRCEEDAIDSLLDVSAEYEESHKIAPFAINDKVRNIEEICSIAKQFYAKHGAIGMIGIDYLTLVRTHQKLQTRERIDYVMEELNQLKKELDTRIVVLCQVGRDAKGNADKRPTIYSAKESGGVEEASDLVIGCYRDEYFNPETTPDRGILELITLKNRYGRCGTVRLAWHGETSTISNLDSYSYYAA